MAKNYFQCPDDLDSLRHISYQTNSTSVFLAGGIGGCPNWRKDVIKNIHNARPELVLVNPEREHYDTKIVTEQEQVTWEYKAMMRCTHILFWFLPPTNNPITLLEYGKVLEMREKFTRDRIFVGADLQYPKRENLIAQTRLARSNSKIVIHDSLDKLVNQVINSI